MRPTLLITGSTGIAAETARRAARRGYNVFFTGLDDAACAPLAEELPDAGCAAGDLREETAVDTAIERCLTQHGGIDALFNVAGISGRRFGDGPLDECTVEGWETTMSTNLRTTFLMSRAVLRHWLESKRGGAILNTASVLATSPEPHRFATHAYAASKGAILALTKSMAAYYAPHGIRVNAVAPGLVATPMSERAQRDPEILEFIEEKQPLARGILHAGDVAEAALFLLGPDARHITGAVLNVDGGWSVS